VGRFFRSFDGEWRFFGRLYFVLNTFRKNDFLDVVLQKFSNFVIRAKIRSIWIYGIAGLAFITALALSLVLTASFHALFNPNYLFLLVAAPILFLGPLIALRIVFKYDWKYIHLQYQDIVDALERKDTSYFDERK
jgi:hypothetical protein